MRISERGIDFIKSFEGFESAPYTCPAGVPTIGYGTTVYPNGKPVKLTDNPIGEALAKSFLLASLAKYQDGVSRYVRVLLTQGQYDALVSFAYNCGLTNLQKSTLLKKLNAGLYSQAADEFMKWVYGNGKKLKGLVNRRTAERALFLGESL